MQYCRLSHWPKYVIITQMKPPLTGKILRKANKVYLRNFGTHSLFAAWLLFVCSLNPLCVFLHSFVCCTGRVLTFLRQLCGDDNSTHVWWVRKHWASCGPNSTYVGQKNTKLFAYNTPFIVQLELKLNTIIGLNHHPPPTHHPPTTHHNKLFNQFLA